MKGSSAEHRKALMVAVSVMDPDTTCIAGMQLHVSARDYFSRQRVALCTGHHRVGSVQHQPATGQASRVGRKLQPAEWSICTTTCTTQSQCLHIIAISPDLV